MPYGGNAANAPDPAQFHENAAADDRNAKIV